MTSTLKTALLLGLVASGTGCAEEDAASVESSTPELTTSAYVDYNESNCTADQRAVLDQAISLAGDNATKAALNYWFGPHEWLGGPSDLAYSRLNDIDAHFNYSPSLPVRCDSLTSPHGSCNGFLARQQDKIRICPDFWNLPLYVEGRPDVSPDQLASMTSVLLHEAAHWVGAGGDEYDAWKSLQLARTDADAAAENAPNYEYHYIAEVFGKPQLFWWQ